MRRWLQILSVVNFIAIVVVLGVVYTSCKSSAPVVSNAAAPPPSRDLSTFAEVAACLDAHGGVIHGRCVTPATVLGIELGPVANDRYFAATKAAVAVAWQSGADAVEGLREECSYRSQPQAQAQVQMPRETNDAALLACVLDRLEKRTTAVGAR
jgi:hypothetical protein